MKTKMIGKKAHLTLEIGDKIKAKGLTVIIAEIIYQEYFDEFFGIEFVDTTGTLRSWKQKEDGGQVIPKSKI